MGMTSDKVRVNFTTLTIPYDPLQPLTTPYSTLIALIPPIATVNFLPNTTL